MISVVKVSSTLHALKAPILVLILAILLPVLFINRAGALPVTDFNPGRIIDDSAFADYGTMSVSNIQFFLNSKGVQCTGGQAPCLKNYTQDGRSSAQIIYDISQQFKINPQVLITVLQKEVGLVTDNSPENWQYRTATGYGCPDTAACDSQYYGFTNQVTWTARMYRAIMNASPTWYTPYVVGNNYIQYNPDAACGGTNVYIQNRATQALYNYTPYQPNQNSLNAGYGTALQANGSQDYCGAYGNRNFFLYFRDWFGNPQQSPLVRTPSSPTYYLITNNKKYAIANGDILYAYGLESAPLSVVSDAYLSTISDGGMLNTIFTNPGDGTVYLADGGKKYGIASGAYCTQWGLACGNTEVQKVVGPEITGMMKDGGVLQSVMKFANTYYLMVNGEKQQFMSQKAMTDRGYSVAGSIPVVNWTNATRPFGVSHPENNTFIKFAKNSAIYLYSGNQFYIIPNLDVFRAWMGPNGTSYLDATSSYNTAAPSTAGALSSLTQSNGIISLIDIDKRYVLSGANPTITPLDITNNTSLTNFLSTRAIIQLDDSKALALSNGTIVALKSGVLRPIPTMTDLRMSYSDANIINVPNTLLTGYPVGKLYMIPGRVFRPSDSGGAMYIYGGDGSLWALGTLNELYPALKWNNDIVNTPFSNIDFVDIKIYSNLAKINNIPYIVMPDGSLRTVPVGSIVSQARVMPLDGDMTKSLHINSSAIRFVRFDNGTIFQINTNEINPISSLTTYKNLGGDSSNTASMPLKALDTFRTGNSIQ